MARLNTREEIRMRLSLMGKTHGDVARELGVSPIVITQLLDGRLKGVRGDAHRAAVALGLKEGIVLDDGQTIAGMIRADAA